MEDLKDAFTGARLNPALGLYKCGSCSVYYHADSAELIREENANQCVACGRRSLQAVTPAQRPSGKNYSPQVVTLDDIHLHYNRVVTFQGRVVDIRQSRSGRDFAAMFEHRPWSKGFKMMFFKSAMPRVGGESFIRSLIGKTVSVRGLLLLHPQYGPEIIVGDRTMILEVAR